MLTDCLFVVRYVGNLPPGITVAQLGEFVNAAMKQVGLCKDNSTNPVISVWISPDSHFAFVEMRSMEEATAALTYLNGIQIGVHSLKIGRPKGYNAASSASLLAAVGGAPIQPSGNGLGGNLLSIGNAITAANPLLSGLAGGAGIVGNGGGGFGLGAAAGLGMLPSAIAEPPSNVIMVSNLPALITEDQIRELFTPFGEVSVSCPRESCSIGFSNCVHGLCCLLPAQSIQPHQDATWTVAVCGLRICTI